MTPQRALRFLETVFNSPGTPVRLEWPHIPASTSHNQGRPNPTSRALLAELIEAKSSSRIRTIFKETRVEHSLISQSLGPTLAFHNIVDGSRVAAHDRGGMHGLAPMFHVAVEDVLGHVLRVHVSKSLVYLLKQERPVSFLSLSETFGEVGTGFRRVRDPNC
jgi:hypothetical protein